MTGLARILSGSLALTRLPGLTAKPGFGRRRSLNVRRVAYCDQSQGALSRISQCFIMHHSTIHHASRDAPSCVSRCSITQLSVLHHPSLSTPSRRVRCSIVCLSVLHRRCTGRTSTTALRSNFVIYEITRGSLRGIRQTRRRESADWQWG